MREFKYNVIDLICYVRDRPCLWDKTIENYKDRTERRSAWEEIFNNLEETYEEMTPEEKRITGDTIIRKWSNVRDSYMKSLRTKPSTRRSKYIYAKDLKFLAKNATDAVLEDLNFNEDESSQSGLASYLLLSPSPTTPETPTSTPEPFIEFPPTVFLSSSTSQDSARQKKKKKEPEVKKKALLEELQKKSCNDTRPDEKETMLLSFLPYIKDMNETEMMDLHMEVLTTIRKIKGKRAQNPGVSTSLSSGSTTPNSLSLSQLPLTPNPKPAIIKINPHKTINFTLLKSQRTGEGELILNKWTNIRDTFIKSLKTKMGRPKKKYLLYNHLEFLTKIIPESERPTEIINSTAFMKEEPDSGYSITTEIEPDTSTSLTISNVTSYIPKKSAKGSDFDDAKSTDFASEISYGRKSNRSKRKSNRFIFTNDTDSVSSKKKSKKASKMNDDISVNDQYSAIDFVEVDDNDPRIMNEDEAFFASLLPTIVKYTEDERLEFRIEVLGIMKKLKEKRTWTAE